MINTLESDIQRTICEYLDLKHHFFWRQNQIPPTQMVGGQRVFRRMPKYSAKGLPDIQIITDGGFTIFLEIKSSKGRQSPDQKDFEQKCKDKGAEYYIIKDVSELREIGL